MTTPATPKRRIFYTEPSEARSTREAAYDSLRTEVNIRHRQKEFRRKLEWVLIVALVAASTTLSLVLYPVVLRWAYPALLY